MKKALLLIGTLCLLLIIGQTKETELIAFTDNEEKVIICHIPPGNPDNAHAIEVSINAVDAHLAHGDSIGDCNKDEDGKDFNPVTINPDSTNDDGVVKSNTSIFTPTGF